MDKSIEYQICATAGFLAVFALIGKILICLKNVDTFLVFYAVVLSISLILCGGIVAQAVRNFDHLGRETGNENQNVQTARRAKVLVGIIALGIVAYGMCLLRIALFLRLFLDEFCSKHDLSITLCLD